jgi:hypothetical protein
MKPNNRQPDTDFAIPNRIETAFRALAYLQSVTMGGMLLTPHGRQAIPARALSGPESALHNMAAETVRLYIGGEIDLDGDATEEPTDDFPF